MKVCYSCKKEKLEVDFAKNHSKKDGLSARCKACDKIYYREYYKKNRDKKIKQTCEYQKKHYKNSDGHWMQLGDHKLGTEAIKTPTQSDIDWFAGFYEGEGTCYSNAAQCCGCAITQKDPEALHEIRDFFGGKVGSYIRKKTGRTYYRWYLSGKRAAAFLQLVLQHPRTTARRKAQIEKVLQ